METEYELFKIREADKIFKVKTFERKTDANCKYNLCFAFTPETREKVLNRVREHVKEISKGYAVIEEYLDNPV